MTTEQGQSVVQWYRVPVDKGTLQALNQRSDRKGLAQTLGYLALISLSGAAAVYGARRWPWPLTLLALFIHGTLFAFTLNAFHELCHGSVFRSKWLNAFFLRLISFLSFQNPVKFTASHMEHHRNTLHPPHDLEVVLPIRHTLRGYLTRQFVDPTGLLASFMETWRLAFGRLQGEWEHRIFPDTAQGPRRRLANWSRVLLTGHALLAAASISAGLWMIPLVTTFARFYGGWLMFLCNETQHVGLQNNVADFRLCCRTVLINPLLRFLYWHMNYHTEHHMYAGVPCYNLRKLHLHIRKHMPRCPRGLVQAWTLINAILQQQKREPGYQYVALLPDAAAPARAK